MAPVSAIPRLLARHHLTFDEIALWQIHEAFAAQVLCNVRGLEDRDFVRAKAGVEHTFGRVPCRSAPGNCYCRIQGPPND